jgi:predicted nucleic acid-binding Zn ribbon protein
MHEKRKGAFSIKELLPDLAKEINMVSLFEIESLSEKWDYIVGSILATHSFPLKKIGSVLIVEADHSVFANDIIMMKKIIISRVQEITMTSEVKEVRVNVIKNTFRRK